MGAQRGMQYRFPHVVRQIVWLEVLGAGGVVLAVVTVERPVSADFEQRQRSSVENRRRNLATRHVFLHQDRVAVAPRQRFWWGVSVPQDHDPDAGSARQGLDHIRPWHRVARRQLVSTDDEAVCHVQSVGGEDVTRRGLVHRQGRGPYPRMRVGHPHYFQQTLDGTVLAGAAVQGVEYDGP